jgi:hypothetical protein
MYRIVDGRIVEHWAFADELGTLHRFGAAVPPEWLALAHRGTRAALEGPAASAPIAPSSDDQPLAP